MRAIATSLWLQSSHPRNGEPEVTTPQVLTVGHSNHSIERFIGLLTLNGVTAVADVRSHPYSRFSPSFNRDPLASALKQQRVAYVFLGRELGARSEDRTCYENGRVQYRRLAATPLFKAGMQRVIDGAQAHRVALLCAEREPLDCHRALLVSRELEGVGVQVAHVHADGSVESHAAAMARLLELLRMPNADLFRSRDELIADAYAAQEQRIAYVNEALRTGTD